MKGGVIPPSAIEEAQTRSVALSPKFTYDSYGGPFFVPGNFEFT